jgi:hypothetical protein
MGAKLLVAVPFWRFATMRRILPVRQIPTLLGLVLAISWLGASPCQALGLFWHTTYYTKTTTKTVTHGHPPVAAAPVAAAPAMAPSFAPAQMFFAPVAPMMAPTMMAPVAPMMVPTMMAPVAPTMMAPSFAAPVAPSYAPPTAPQAAPAVPASPQAASPQR